MQPNSPFRLRRWRTPAAAVLLASAVPIAAFGRSAPRPPLPPQPALQRDLVVDGDFGGVSTFTVDAAGRIYVADYQVQQIHAFSPTGARLPAIGRRGRGPGEFRGIVSVVAGRGDTLFAFDAAEQRITAFAPGAARRVAYTVSVPRSGATRAAYQLLAPASGGFLLPFSAPHGADGGVESKRVFLHMVTARGELGSRPVLRYRDREALVSRSASGIAVGPLPYGRSPYLGMGPGDRMYFGWNGNRQISMFDVRGRPAGSFSLPGAAQPVRSQDVRRLLESYPEGTPERAMIEEAVEQKRVPSVKPAYKAFLVDDRGRVWLNVTTADDVVVMTDEGLAYVSTRTTSAPPPSPWWVLDASGRRVATLSLPNNVRLGVVRGGRAYGVETDADGVVRIVRYRTPV